jgi:flagellar capping protein FliD
MNIYLTSSAQSQLTQLKAINQIPLTRIDAKTKTAQTEQKAIESVKTELGQAKAALAKLGSETGAPSADVVNAFVKEFNELQSLLKKSTDKDATLSRNAEARNARTDVRSAFSSYEVLSAARAAGIETTRDGLVAVNATEALTPEALQKMGEALDKVASGMDSANSRASARLDTLAKERERAATFVTAADARTEKNFLKMYQIMQAMNAETTGASKFGGLF